MRYFAIGCIIRACRLTTYFKLRCIMSDGKKNVEKKANINVQIDDTTSLGKYTNLTSVSSTQNEFVLDFGFFHPSQGFARIHSRAILSPRQAKSFALNLSSILVQYEEMFGVIDTGDGDSDDLVQ